VTSEDNKIDQTDEDLAQLAYTAYGNKTGNRSIVTGDKLPPWEGLREDVKDAWRHTVQQVKYALLTEQREDARSQG